MRSVHHRARNARPPTYMFPVITIIIVVIPPLNGCYCSVGEERARTTREQTLAFSVLAHSLHFCHRGGSQSL